MARIFVDLDGTLCTQREDGNYQHAQPYHERIEEVRRLWDQGHEVVVWTARGTGTGEDWREETLDQLRRWDVPFSRLSVGEKPVYDLLIDDRAREADSYFAPDPIETEVPSSYR